MFKAICAYRIADDGAFAFLDPQDTPEDHQQFAELRVGFTVSDLYPPEPDIGMGWDWAGDIDSIKLRVEGGAFTRFRTLRDADYAAARAFLLRVHGRELWEAGDVYAEALFYGEAA